MSNEELEKETPEVEEPQTEEPLESLEPIVEKGEEETPLEPDVVTLTKEELDALKKKAQTADNYKKELEGYRKPKREIVSETSVKETPQENLIEHDFMSKRADVLAEVNDDISELEDGEWEKIEHLIAPAIDAVYQKALKKGDYVARTDIKRAVSDLVTYAKGEKSTKKAIEEARIKGATEMTKLEQAEISGVKVKKSAGGYTDADAERAKVTGRTPLQEKELRLKAEERKREYAVPDPLA